MKRSPSLAPTFDSDVYLVVDEFDGSPVYREAEEFEANRETVILDISSGQYSKPVRIVSFNIAEGWSRDVTEDIAREIVDAAVRRGHQLNRSAKTFVERTLGEDVPASILQGH